MYLQMQANYAARIYALAIAMNMRGILWYTLLEQGRGFQNSHLADLSSSGVTPRPAFYAYRNAALLLRDAVYTGPPLTDVRFDQDGMVQTLRFAAHDGAHSISSGDPALLTTSGGVLWCNPAHGRCAFHTWSVRRR